MVFSVTIYKNITSDSTEGILNFFGGNLTIEKIKWW
jgi:hypothetical protein